MEKVDYSKLTVEEAYHSGLAKRIGIPSLSSMSPQANGATPVGIHYKQPSNNGNYVTIADLYPSLSDEEKAMTVEEFLASKKPKNTLIWVLLVLAIVLILLSYLGIRRYL